jgi:hypothetical protein
MADLLNTSNVLGNILDTDWILNCQSMRLTFNSGFINQDSSIGRQPCLSVSFSPSIPLHGDKGTYRQKRHRRDHQAWRLYGLSLDLVVEEPTSSRLQGLHMIYLVHRPGY